MDQTNIDNVSTKNQSNQDIIPPVISPVKPSRTNPSLVWIIGAIVVMIICIITTTTVILQNKPITTIIMVTPTPVMTVPTPIRASNPIATSSAYLDLETKVLDLSNALNKVNINDSNLYPPVLDLPLGFSN